MKQSDLKIRGAANSDTFSDRSNAMVLPSIDTQARLSVSQRVVEVAAIAKFVGPIIAKAFAGELIKNIFFTDTKKAIKEISKQLHEIQKGIGEIRRALTEISETLLRIEGKIDLLPSREVVNRVVALNSVIFENYSEWADSIEAGPQDDLRRLRLDLQIANRELIQVSQDPVTYAYALDVALSFSCELNLMLLMGVADSSIAESCRVVDSFLKRSIDPDEKSSIGHQLKLVRFDIAELEAWEASLVREAKLGWSGYIRTDEDKFGTLWCRYDRTDELNGSLSTGFELKERWENRQCYWEERPVGQPIRSISLVHAMDLRSSNGLVDKSILDRNVLIYRNLRVHEQFLLSVKETIESVRDAIQARLDVHDAR